MENLFSAVRGGESEVVSPAGQGNGSEPDAVGGMLPEVVFVGAADAMGRVLSLANALLVELGGLSLGGAGRGALRTLVAALGRVRAGADAAEARTVTALDGLGDGGVDAVEVLRRNTGSSHREARRRRQRAGTLAKMPKVTEALAKGAISPEHADALARAASATSPETVDEDAALLAQVAAVPADRAGRHIQDWTQRNQDPADLHEQHLRQRRRRRLHFGDGDDGMLMAHAAFDRVLGAQFRSLINGIADRIWRAEGGRENPDARSVEQRRLDALAIAVGLHPGPADSAPAGGVRGGGERPAGASRSRGPAGATVRPPVGKECGSRVAVPAALWPVMSRAWVAAMRGYRWRGVAMARRDRSRPVIRLSLWLRPTWCRGRIRRGGARSPGSARFHRPNWSDWPATPSCSGCCSRVTASRSGMAVASAPPRTPSVAPWLFVTAVACSARPSRPGVRLTTSCRGANPPKAPPTLTIWLCSATRVITGCTTTSASSSGNRTALGV